MKTNKIKINDKELEIKFDSEAMFRYSKEGGDKRLLEGKGKEISEDKAFFVLVLFVWAMLKGDSKEIYLTPESLSALFFPLPNEKVIEEIYSYLQSDLNEFEKQNT